MKITTTRDRTMNHVRALLHGDSGIGKTTGLKTLPANQTLIVAAERSVLPLRRHGYALIVIESWDDVRKLFCMLLDAETLHAELEQADALPEGFKEVRIVAIDSLTAFSELCKENILRVDRRKLIRERTNKATDRPAGVYDDQLTQEDWGLYRTRILNCISTFCHLPYHIIFTSLSAWVQDKTSKEIARTPNLNGKAALECPAYFDLVLHMKAADPDDDGKPRRVWQTYNGGGILAKDASGALEPHEPPDWTSVLAKILKGAAKTETQTQESK